jgi:hypothetical protein
MPESVGLPAAAAVALAEVWAMTQQQTDLETVSTRHSHGWCWRGCVVLDPSQLLCHLHRRNKNTSPAVACCKKHSTLILIATQSCCIEQVEQSMQVAAFGRLHHLCAVAVAGCAAAASHGCLCS